MPLRRKLGPANPPSLGKRLQQSSPSIVLMLLLVVFAIASFVTPPSRGIPLSSFWERSLYVELFIAGLAGLFGIVGNWYWPVKVAYGVTAVVFALLTVYLAADPSFSVRGKLYPAMMCLAATTLYYATKPYLRSFTAQRSASLSRVIEEFRADPSDGGDRNG